ncbi:MAG: rhodanese-like domain-containing protein [Pseudomonadota bacterium]
MEPYVEFALKHLALVGVWAFVLLVFIVVEWRYRRYRPLQRSPQEVTQAINHEQARLLDIRSQDQYAAGHIIGAKWMDPARIQQEGVKGIKRFSNTPIILVCNDGRLAARVAQQLVRQGTQMIFALEGGLQAWRKEGFPVVQD